MQFSHFANTFTVSVLKASICTLPRLPSATGADSIIFIHYHGGVELLRLESILAVLCV